MKYFTLLLAALSTSVSAATLGSKLFSQSPLSAPGTGNPVPGQSPLIYCGPNNDDILKIDYVDMSPNPPTQGSNLTITAAGFLRQAIDEGAYVVVDVKYGYIRLIHQKVDLCENAGQVELKCPIEKGDIKLEKQVELPKVIPPGKYHVEAKVFTKDDEPITCLTADITFHPQKPGLFQ